MGCGRKRNMLTQTLPNWIMERLFKTPNHGERNVSKKCQLCANDLMTCTPRALNSHDDHHRAAFCSVQLIHPHSLASSVLINCSNDHLHKNTQNHINWNYVSLYYRYVLYETNNSNSITLNIYTPTQSAHQKCYI